MAAAGLGCLWGFGHSAGQGVLGLLFLLFREKLTGTFPLLAQSAGLVIGLSLIAIGLHGWHEARELEEETAAEAAVGVSVVAAPAQPEQKQGFGVATFATGVVYGLQPDALLMILPALALPSAAASVAFISAFVLGTALAMGGYAACISQVCAALGERVPSVTTKLATIAAFFAMALGGSMVVSSAFNWVAA